MTIIVNNSGSNDGEYKIFSVTDSELILESTAELADETDNTDAALQLRGLGNGIEGTVIITDTGYNLCTTVDSDGNPVDYIPLVTTYTRIGDTVQVSNNDYDNIFGTTSSVEANEPIGYYQPVADQRYYWITGEKAMQMSVTEWTTTSWLGINLSSSVSSHTSYVLPPTAVDLGQEANYADVPDGLNYDGYQYEYEEITTSSLDIWQRWTTTRGWWIFSTTDYHLRHINLTGYTAYDIHSVSADNTIGIEFMGSDSGTITIKSDSNDNVYITDIYLEGVINNVNGETTISSSGSIYQNSSSAVIRSEDITLTAAGAIGSYDTSPATITRSSGDWTSEGYSEGDVIRFTEGFGSNNDREFTILSVDAATLTLDYGSGLVAATDSDGFTIYNLTDDTTTEYSIDSPILTAVAEVTEVASVRTDLYGGELNTTAQGLVAIDEIDEKLTIGNVESVDGDVIIRSDGGIYSADASSLIQGDNIELTAATGGLGTADLGLRVDTNNDNDYNDDDKADALTAQAFGDIFISEISGDLRLVSVESLGGDVDIIAGDGNLIDANDIEYQDVRTTDELSDLWDDMNLLDDDGSETQTAYKDLKTNEYQTYWNYRTGESKVFNSQTNVDGISEEIYFDSDHGFSTGDALIYRVIDGTGISGSIADEVTYYAIVVDATTIRLAASRDDALAGTAMDIGAAGSESYVSLTHMLDYDENYRIVFSAEEREAYKTQLSWDDDRIDLEEIKRTEEFRDLHSRYGVLGDIYNPGWQYEEGYTGYVSDFEAAAAVDSENDTISIGTHLLSTGTAVLYNANGGDAIGNLTDGELYFVIVIDSSTVQLAESSEDALNGIFIDIDGPVASGTEHNLSDVDALAVGAQWTEDQLLYSLGAGWLKETTDTEAQIEAANVIANNITIDVSGAVGEHGEEQQILIHENGDMEIVGSSITGTTQEDIDNRTKEAKAALAGAEKEDLVSIKGDTDTISFGGLHNLETGDEISFGPGTSFELSDVPGVNNGTTYYVRVVDEFTVQLFDTEANASGTDDTGLIDITGSEARIAQREDLDVQSGGKVTIITIPVSEGDMETDGTEITLTQAEQDLIDATDPADITFIDSAANTIIFGTAHDLASGTSINFGAFGTFDLSDIPGVTDDVVYYARVIDATTIQLFDTEENALGSDDTGLINITSSEVKISQHQSESSEINITAGSYIFLGSETDVYIGNLSSGQVDSSDSEIRIKTGGGIYASTGSSGVNIIGGNLILEAAEGGIGADGIPVTMDLTQDSRLNARAKEGIFLEETNGNMYVDTVFSPERVDLYADGAILDAFSGNYLNIRTGELNLHAGSTIGTGDNFLDIDLFQEESVLNAYSGGDINIFETDGDMNVGEITASNGDVELRAMASILDIDDELQADVTGNDIILEAMYGGIGSSGNDLDINSAYAADGTLTSSSALNTYITETDGDLGINQVATGIDYTAFIGSGASILNARLDDEDNIISGAAWLFADTNIGTSDRRIRTAIGNLEGRSVNGSIWLINQGHLIIGGATEADGIEAGLSLNITAHSPMTVTERIEAGDITLTTEDNTDSDHITIQTGVNVISTGGSIIMYSGDNIIIEDGANVNAAGNVELYVDFANADPGIGGVLEMLGLVTGTSVQIYGNSDDDIIPLTYTVSPTSIDTGAGDDIIFLGSNATPGSNIDGNVQNILEFIDIDGGAGSDSLYLDITGDVDGVTGTVTENSITGFNMGADGWVQYIRIENLNLGLGSGDDVLNIQGTPAGNITNLNTGAGDDVINISSDSPTNSGDLDDINGTINLDAGAGSNTLNVGDAGSAAADTNVTIADSSISGLAPADINYTATSGSFEGGINIIFGTGNDIITVESVRSETLTILNGNAGDDTVTLEATVTDGRLEIHGDAGTDEVDASAVPVGAELVIIGEEGADTLTGGQGDDVIFGDEAVITRDADYTITRIESNDHGIGDNDVITGNDGDDIVVGGFGSDTVTGGTGDDIVIGDNGSIEFTSGIVTFIESTDADDSTVGDDTIDAGAGDNYVIAGGGSDSVSSEGGDDYVIGDHGTMTFTDAGVLFQIATMLDNYGSDDTLSLGDGNNLAIGGQGADTIITGTGNDALLGDSGVINRDATGVITGIESISPDEGGNDIITSGDGMNYIVAGTGDDTVTTGTGNDFVVGDNGSMTFTSGIVTAMESTDAADSTAGDDTIDAGTGDNYVIAGGGSDSVSSEGGDDYVTGDHGTMTFTDAGVLTRIATMLDNYGSDDTLNLGDGNNVAIGGQGSDSLTTGRNDDIILGDSGFSDFDTEGLLTNVATRSPASGGDDIIVSGDGNDIIFGGSGSDYIDVDPVTNTSIGAGEGNDIIGGDNGYVSFDADDGQSVLTVFESTDPEFGGDDNIYSGSGNDMITGGTGNDNINSGSGDDTVLGDNGAITLVDGKISDITPADIVAYASGDDQIETGDGNDIVIAGIGSDTVDSGNGDDIVIGDLARILLEEGLPDQIISIQTQLGGQDDIFGGDGFDILLGGEGRDRISGGNGIDILIGDNGFIDFIDGKPSVVETRQSPFGNGDYLDGGEDSDIIIGGEGRDTVIGEFPTDVIIGKYGRVVLDDYTVISVYPSPDQVPGNPLHSREARSPGQSPSSGPDRSLFMNTGVEAITPGLVLSGANETFNHNALYMTVPEDGDTGAATGNIKTVILPDGSIEKTYPNGMFEVIKIDGTVITRSPDGRERIEDPDGIITIIYPNGMKTIKYPDGSSITTYPDGRVIKVLPDGIIINSSAENEGTELRLNKFLLNAFKNTDGLFDIEENDNLFRDLKSEDNSDRIPQKINIGSMIAGLSGWGVYSSGKHDKENLLSRDSFQKLDRKNKLRRFIKWSNGRLENRAAKEFTFLKKKDLN